MKKYAFAIGVFIALLLFTHRLFSQQPQDGENSYLLSAVNKRFLTEPDTISCHAGRGVYVAAKPDLDGDDKPEIIVTNRSDGGRVMVFEAIGDNKLEYVWGSKKLNPGFKENGERHLGGRKTPRTVWVGDLDNNGKMEIHFQVGYDPKNELEKMQRGLYIYEFIGIDNDYGVEPVRHIPFEEIDPVLENIGLGTIENPLICEDIDGDGKNELLFLSHTFDANLDAGNMYILEVESGTFANGDANLRVEYKYDAMARAFEFGTDGTIPVSTAVGDVDNDGRKEIVIMGRANIEPRSAIGLLEITDIDTYVPKSLVQFSEENLFQVKADVDIVEAEGQTAIIFAGGISDQFKTIYVIDNIVSDDLVGPGDVKVLSEGTAVWGIMAIGDQDHGSGSDGFDIYVSAEKEIVDIEYNGSGALSEPANYTNHGRIGAFNLVDVYDVSEGFFNSIFTYPGMDLDGDGNREIIVGYKGGCQDIGANNGDKLQGENFFENSYAIFVFEWGDSTQSIPITLTTDVEYRSGAWTVITPDDYQLEQNYPNPFNPTTNISFTLPLNKNISLKIYNSLGQEIRTLIDNETYPEGRYTVQWDARDDNGHVVASGVYIYKLIFGNFSKSKQMTVVR